MSDGDAALAGMHDFHESPLLSYPNLMLIVLKAASRGEATLEDCVEDLRQRLAEAHERSAAGRAAIIGQLETCRSHLMIAKLLEPAGSGRFRLTARGRDMLAANPTGVDDSALMQFAEFRRYIEQAQRHPAPDNPRTREYDEGANAFRGGQDLSANPYEPDTIKHQAWENGWYGALDSQADWVMS